MLMILARLGRSESFWAVVKVRSPHTASRQAALPRPAASPPFHSGTDSMFLIVHTEN